MMIQILHATAILSLVFAFPGLLFCLQYNITGFRTLRSHSIWVNGIQTCSIVVLAGVDWLLVCPTVDMILIHTSTTTTWQNWMIHQWYAIFQYNEAPSLWKLCLAGPIRLN